jgi:hypothetical protein
MPAVSSRPDQQSSSEVTLRAACLSEKQTMNGRRHDVWVAQAVGQTCAAISSSGRLSIDCRCTWLSNAPWWLLPGMCKGGRLAWHGLGCALAASCRASITTMELSHAGSSNQGRCRQSHDCRGLRALNLQTALLECCHSAFMHVKCRHSTHKSLEYVQQRSRDTNAAHAGGCCQSKGDPESLTAREVPTQQHDNNQHSLRDSIITLHVCHMVSHRSESLLAS